MENFCDLYNEHVKNKICKNINIPTEMYSKVMHRDVKKRKNKNVD